MSRFMDRADVVVVAGRGGNGSKAMRHEKYVPLGGPWGGDGGRGGDVIVTASRDLRTLIDIAQARRFEAKSGDSGSVNNRSGRSGDDLRLEVPSGTLILDQETGERLADLTEHGQTFTAAKGGRGGRGNSHFKSATRQAPTLAEKGEPGEERKLRMELKLLADAGLVGFPNAGKSTFLSVVSAARPKVADYPFTTLVPELGVVRLGPESTFVLADLPGLVEGAHAGKGLGLRFLKHLERTRVLLYLLDGGREDADLVKDLKVLEGELKAYHPGMAKLPKLVAVSKADLPWAADHHQALTKALARRKIKPALISGVTGLGVKALLGALYKQVRLAPASVLERASVEAPKRKVYRPAARFTVTASDAGWILEGKEVRKWVALTDFDNIEAVRKLRFIFSKIGLTQALREAGAQEGDSIIVGKEEFFYQP